MAKKEVIQSKNWPALQGGVAVVDAVVEIP